jgi:hypothetical protein
MSRLPCSYVAVKDADAAQSLAIELVRNAVVARSRANVLLVGGNNWARIQGFIEDEAPRYGAESDRSRESCDVLVVGGSIESVPDRVGLLVVLPAARTDVDAERRVEIALGEPVGEVVVVPGTARQVNGVHALTEESVERLRRAEDIARRRRVRAVILSGWNGRIETSRSEAEQMFEAWRGPRVPLILDDAARTTAENALWAASLTSALGGVRKVRVVVPWVGALRLGLAFFIAFRRTKVVPVLSTVWGRAQAVSWRPAVVGLVYLRRHLRIGRAVIANGAEHPQAQL